MPNYSKPEVVLVRYPFSDLMGAKVRPAVVVSAPVDQWGCDPKRRRDIRSVGPGSCMFAPLTAFTPPSHASGSTRIPAPASEGSPSSHPG